MIQWHSKFAFSAGELSLRLNPVNWNKFGVLFEIKYFVFYRDFIKKLVIERSERIGQRKGQVNLSLSFVCKWFKATKLYLYIIQILSLIEPT